MKRLFLAVGLLFLFTAEATAQGLPLAPPRNWGSTPTALIVSWSWSRKRSTARRWPAR